MGAVGSEPATADERRISSTPAIDKIHDATILGSRAGAIANGTSPLVVMVVPIKHNIDSVSLKERYEISLHLSIAPNISGAIRWDVEDDDFPWLAGRLQVIQQPIELSAASAKILIGVQRHKVCVPPVKRVVFFKMPGWRICWQGEDTLVSLIAAASSIHFMVSNGSQEGCIAQHRLVDVEKVSYILAPGAGAARADAAIVDHVSRMEHKVRVLLFHHSGDVQRHLIWRRICSRGLAITQDSECEIGPCSFGGGSERDHRPRRDVAARVEYFVVIGSVGAQARDHG